jgi:Fe-S-cluster containining protein
MKKHKFKFVPCNGCTLCCQGDAIRLTEEDNPDDYETEPHPYIAGEKMIAFILMKTAAVYTIVHLPFAEVLTAAHLHLNMISILQ